MIRALSNEPVNGRWLLTGLAGRGSSATVYRAFDLVDERLVAIKSLGERGSPAHLCRRARREFLGMSSLRHPHLVESYEYGEARSGPLAPGSPFFTMELLEGADLGGRGVAGARRLARAALGLLAALECVHGHGLVHGDVKPSNVFADARAERGGRIKLGDLGLARRPRAGGGDGRLTGTLHYAAPERIAGGPADGRSDLYSLGVLLYEAATGGLPFDEADPAAALAWHLRAASGVEDDDASLPPPLARVIGRLLRTRPEERPTSAREVWEEIAESSPGSVESGDRDEDCDGLLMGRSRERARIGRWLAARGAAGGFLEILGPPGSGVSRLAREAAQAGRARGWSVHAWTCRKEDSPFAPLGRPLREIILREGGTASRRTPSEGEVLALLGGPALWSAPDRLVALAGPPLAGAIAAFLAARAAGAPRLLVLDDAHHLDAASALVLRALAETGTGATRGLLVVAAAHVAEASAAASNAHAPEAAAPAASTVRAGGREMLSAIRPHLARLSGAGRGAPGARDSGRRGAGAVAAPARESIVLGALTEGQSRRMVEALPGIGALTAREVDGLVRASRGLPGRLARLARSMAGRQLALFPPLCEPVGYHSRRG